MWLKGLDYARVKCGWLSGKEANERALAACNLTGCVQAFFVQGFFDGRGLVPKRGAS
jgi:hypothetical protein